MSSYIRTILILSLHNTALGNPVVDFIYGCCSLIAGHGKQQRIIDEGTHSPQKSAPIKQRASYSSYKNL